MEYFKKLYEFIALSIDDSNVYEMANIQPDDSGLPYIVNVMNKGGAKHGPRVKVSNIVGTYAFNDNFTITVDPYPRIIGKSKVGLEVEKLIIDWVKLNYTHIHAIWNSNGTMSGTEIDAGFKKI